MNQFRIFVILLVVFAGIVLLQNMKVKSQSTGKKTLGAETVATPSLVITNTPTATDVPTNSPTVNPIQKNPTDTSTPPASAPHVETSNNIYPNSHITNQSSGSVTMESSDSTDTITDWYKGLIQSQNMSINTFVKTNSNGNVKNVLSGSNGGTTIKITITKNSGDTIAVILVEKN